MEKFKYIIFRETTLERLNQSDIVILLNRPMEKYYILYILHSVLRIRKDLQILLTNTEPVGLWTPGGLRSSRYRCDMYVQQTVNERYMDRGTALSKFFHCFNYRSEFGV